MLKIKDNIDLKELEKFGYFKNKDINYLKYLIDKETYLDSIQIDLHTRVITRHLKNIYLDEIICKRVANSCIQDLIQAGLIEKVKEK